MAHTAEGRNGSKTTMGQRLASLRALAGLSQTEAAARAGISQPYLSLLESDNAAKPPAQTLAKLAEIYDTTLDYIVRDISPAAA